MASLDGVLPRTLRVAGSRRGRAVGTIRIGATARRIVVGQRGKLTVRRLKGAAVTTAGRRWRVAKLPARSREVTLTLSITSVRKLTSSRRRALRRQITARVVRADGSRSPLLRPGTNRAAR
jgi:hypothetical protein